jgi:peptidoglycan hydrolase-like protein with peptidoglycan-binding domain
MEPGEGSTFNENGMPSKPMVYENDPYPVDDILKNDNVPDAFKIGIMRVRELADDGVDIVLAREKVALEPATNPEPSPEVEPEPEIVPVSETPAKPSQEEPVAEPIVVPQTSIIDAMGSGVMPYDPKVAELQQKLADLDPKYKPMMEYTKADGSNGCIDGIAGDRTRACVTQFIMDNGLGIKDMSIEKLTELVEAKQEKAVTAELDTEVELETQAPEITLPEYEIMKELPPSEMVASTEGANRRVGEQETFATVKEAAAARIQSAVYQQPDPSNTAQLQAFNA